MPGLPEGSQLGQHWAAPAAVAAASATAAAVAATAAAGGPACADWHLGPNTAAAAASQLLLGKPAPTPLPTWGGGGGVSWEREARCVPEGGRLTTAFYACAIYYRSLPTFLLG